MMGASSTGGGGLFGSKPAATGGGLFGASANKPSGGLFGSSTTSGMSSSGGGGLFGSKPATTGGGLFGGGSNTSAQKSTFFSGTQSTGFGQPAGSSFGATTQASLENGTAAIYFKGIKDKDHGDSKSLITLNAITAEPSYCQFSFEELRMADYMLKKQGKINFPIGAQPSQNQPASTGFGSASSFGGGQKSGGKDYIFDILNHITINLIIFNLIFIGLFGSSSTTASSGGLFGGKLPI